MIVGGLRLAGRALGMLAKPGVGGKIARGVGESALAAGVFAGAGPAYDLVTGNAVEKAQDEILKKGTTDGTYDIDFGNRVKSTISGILTGGKDTIDDASLEARKKEKNTYSLLKDPKNALFRKQLLGIEVNPEDIAGGSVLGLKAEYSDQIRRKELQKEAEVLNLIKKSDPSYIDPKETQTYNRNQAKEARLDRLTREKQARLDSLDSRADSLAQSMANLDFKKGESNREYDFRTKQLAYDAGIKKDARRAKILASLGGLGLLFTA